MTICGRVAVAAAVVTSKFAARGIFTDIGESLQERTAAPSTTASAARAGQSRMRRPDQCELSRIGAMSAKSDSLRLTIGLGTISAEPEGLNSNECLPLREHVIDGSRSG